MLELSGLGTVLKERFSEHGNEAVTFLGALTGIVLPGSRAPSHPTHLQHLCSYQRNAEVLHFSHSGQKSCPVSDRRLGALWRRPDALRALGQICAAAHRLLGALTSQATSVCRLVASLYLASLVVAFSGIGWERRALKVCGLGTRLSPTK